VRGLGLVAAVGVLFGLVCLFVELCHLVGIAVVGGDDGYTVQALNDCEQSAELKVKRFH